MATRNPIDIVYYRKRGWLHVGRTRMILFDLLQGFYILQKVIKSEVGENASYLIFQAGIRGGLSFLEPMIESGRIQPGPEGFAEGLSVFTDGGFGEFKIGEMNWKEGWAVITCDGSVEGWIHARKRSRVKNPLCHYSRGIILGFMRATHLHSKPSLVDQLDCVEISCLAAGQKRCTFVVGKQSTIKRHGYEPSQPRRSIQDQLRERVWEKTREIQRANEFHERILGNAPVGIFTLNAEGIVTSANLAASRILGLARRNLLGLDILHQQEFFSSGLAEHLSQGLRGMRFDLVDCPLITRNRGPRYMSLKGIPLRKAQDLTGDLLCIMEDTTEKTLAAQRVSYLKKYNENIIQSITDGIMVLDPSLKILTWNRKMEEIFHLDQKRALGKKLEQVHQAFSDGILLQRLKKVIKTGKELEEKGFGFRTRTRATIVLNLKIIPLLDESNKVSGIIVLHEDITDKERVEIRYKNLFETAQDGICLTDLRGRVISANKKVLTVLETDWKSLNGTSLNRFLPPDKRKGLREKLGLVIQGEEVEPYEVALISTSGKSIPVELSMTAVRNEERVYGLHIIGRDITQRKKMEIQMIEASKLAAVGEIASGVAHEINNPLASVAGYAEEMLDLITEKPTWKSKDLSELREALRTILEQAQRCKEITQSLLNFARQGEFEVIPARVDDIIEKTIHLIDPDLRVNRTKVIKAAAPGLPLAQTNPAQLQQVLLNILKNGIDAVAHKRDHGLITVNSKAEDGFIRIEIGDNGKGIPGRDMGKIFNPFFTTKAPGKGTGLGLSICDRIMKKLNGTIEVNSQAGSGTRFILRLPQHEKNVGTCGN